MNNLLKDFKIQPTKLRGENMSIYEASITNPKKQLEFYKQLSEQLQQENKQLKGSLQTYEVLVKSNVDAIKNKNVLDELEKWLEEEIKQYDNVGLKLKKQGNFECASRSYDYLKQYQTMLSKLKKLKGESNER